MRKAFIDALVEEAEKDKRIYLITADMGYGLVEPFAEKYPSRFINVGVAEQNMIGIAAGLALSGKIVFVYSIANFPTFRCLEQIRNDVCYHNLNVNIVAGGTGLGYGALGSTHHAVEDLAIMRALPNMTVIAPGYPVEVTRATKAICGYNGPCYMRLSNAKKSNILQNYYGFEIGKAITMNSGGGLALIATGSMLDATLQAANLIGQRTIVLDMHTIKPLDEEAIISITKIVDKIITIEEHSIIGGLGSAVAEVLADNGISITFKRMGVQDKYCSKVGSHEELLEDNGLTVEDIVSEVARCP